LARYLWQASYSAEGAKGVLKDGGTGRVSAIEKVLAGIGGTLEAAYFAFGEDDFVGIAEIPDNVSAAAVSMTVASTGAARVKTTVLLTPEELDQAAQKSIDYTPPGR
jgi:uncharacterized protein with GYD domain